MRTREKDLIKPALAILSSEETLSNGMTTTELAIALRSAITPSPDDLVQLKGRKDDKLSQVIRNLISHRTLIKTNYVEYTPPSYGQPGRLRLSPKGKIELLDRNESLSNKPNNHTPIYIKERGASDAETG